MRPLSAYHFQYLNRPSFRDTTSIELPRASLLKIQSRRQIGYKIDKAP